MKISEALRARADEQGVPEQEALQMGMEGKSGEFVDKTGEPNLKV